MAVADKVNLPKPERKLRRFASDGSRYRLLDMIFSLG
jgi:hypothetical protein